MATLSRQKQKSSQKSQTNKNVKTGKTKNYSISEQKFKIKPNFQKFEKEYFAYYEKQVKEIKSKYPEITKKTRRTGKALKNICFFVWYYTQGEKGEISNILFKSSVLLSAQDDFLDNSKIDNLLKRKFCFICNNLFDGKKNKSHSKQTVQFQKLIAFWEEIIKDIKRLAPKSYERWKKAAKQMNKAMIEECNYNKSKNQMISFEEYKERGSFSIGAIFIWTTYFILKKTPVNVLKKIKPVFLSGALIARLSNDILSYRKKKNKINAVNIIKGKKNPEKYILELIKKEKKVLDKNLKKLKIEKWIKQTISRACEFLIEFYKKSDFVKNY